MCPHSLTSSLGQTSSDSKMPPPDTGPIGRLSALLGKVKKKDVSSAPAAFTFLHPEVCTLLFSKLRSSATAFRKHLPTHSHS